MNLTLRTSGNLLCRAGDGFADSLTGGWPDRLGSHSFARVPLGGKPDPDKPEVSPERRTHQAVYLARPDADRDVHLHPQLWLMMDEPGARSSSVTLDRVDNTQRHGRLPHLTGGSVETAEAANAPADTHTVVLAHHGTITAADSTDPATARTARDRPADSSAELTI